MIRFLNKICLLGGGGFSNQLLQDIDNYDYKIFLNKKRIYFNSFYSKDSRNLNINKNHLYLITIAKPEIKSKVINDLKDIEYIDAIFVSSSISKKIKYNKNLIIWKSFVGDNVEFSDNIYIGPYSIIARESKIGKNVSIYPRVSILKGSIIKDNVSIGTNTVITDNCTIGENSIIGPNITVYEDLPNNSVIFK